jgi:uncharacterized Zn ribbon protein
MRPKCSKCNTELTGRIRYHHTICPNCGKKWRLNETNTEIYTTVLEVQPITHGQKIVFRSEENG